MDTNAYYALLAPLFPALMLLEYLLARRRGAQVYRLGDTIANLSCGLGQILLGVFTAGFILTTYDWFYESFAILTWSPTSKAPWVLAFIGVDLCYYGWHRASHRVHLLWAIHAPHHQSEEMNISVALRQPFVSDLSALLFFWPLPLIGIPRDAFFFAVGVLSVYEASLHTRLVNATLPWGYGMNTPAYHRLHHAVNERYRDRNFGSTTIVWDRLFGTFVTEREAPRYGTVTPLGSVNPLFAQVAPFVELWDKCRRAPRLRDKLRVWVMPPEWEPLGALPAVPAPKRAPLSTSPAVNLYAAVQFAAVVVLAFVTLRMTEKISLGESALLVSLALAGMATVGGILEGKPWAVAGEAARLVAMAGAGALLAARLSAPWISSIAFGVSLVSGLWLLRLRARVNALA